MPAKALVTGGAGFIGSAVVRHLLGQGHEVLVLDKMTYAANPMTLDELRARPGCHFLQADIGDGQAVASAFAAFHPDLVLHLAAESHVDRSIERPATFIETNVVGTQILLEAALNHWRGLSEAGKAAFRFHHVSTDEVFGSLGNSGFFTETTAYDPRSPYSASKAAADHLVRAFHHTFGLPVLVTNCSNNYGPYHFPEKLIPLNILRGLKGDPMPVYGKGLNVRDWLYVEDHAVALAMVASRGRIGETYVIGGRAERRNIDVVNAIADGLDELAPGPKPRRDLITFVADRPGHDHRYAIDAAKIENELGWKPSVTFETGLRRTIEWYLARREWWQPILDGSYRLERLGLQVAATS